MEMTCVHYSRDYVGNPCIVALDRDRCVVADGTGQVVLVDLPAQEIRARIYVGVVGGAAACNLRSLRRHPARPGIVAVATRGGYAVVVEVDRQQVAKIHPVQGGTVQAVAFSPDGRILAIGTGAYSTSGEPQSAHVELRLFSDDEPPTYAGFAALPGVCVDAMTWNADGDLLACAIRPPVAEIRLHRPARGRGPQGAIVLRAALDGRGAVVLRRSRVAGQPPGRRLQGGVPPAWRGRRQGGLAGRLARGLRTAPGLRPRPDQRADRPEQRREILDPLDGAERSRFLAMKDCTSIAARPGGGYIGASTRGRIYCWD